MISLIQRVSLAKLRTKRYDLISAADLQTDGGEDSWARPWPTADRTWAPARWSAMDAAPSSPELLGFSISVTKRRTAGTGRKRTATRSHLATLLDPRGNEGLGNGGGTRAAPARSNASTRSLLGLGFAAGWANGVRGSVGGLYRIPNRVEGRPPWKPGLLGGFPPSPAR